MVTLASAHTIEINVAMRVQLSIPGTAKNATVAESNTVAFEKDLLVG